MVERGSTLAYTTFAVGGSARLPGFAAAFAG
jgi:hypothetical protein